MSTANSSAAATSPLTDCDLLVLGSGAGGLSAAVTAAYLGLKVIVAEKDPQYGGTTAWSGGWMWVPRNPLATEAGLTEPLEEPLAYLRHELGARFDEARARAYLQAGPAMVDFFRKNTALQFIDGNAIPDFHGNSPHAARGGRSLCAAPFDGRRLGKHIAALKPPLPETTLWGMGIASGAELRHFLNALREPASFWYVTRRLLAYARDVLLYRRGMRLVNGNALVAGLAASALERGVDIRVRSPARELCMENGRVTGAVLQTPAGDVTVRARCGVLLACGGFPHDVARKKELLAHTRSGHEHWSAASRGNTGDGLRLGERAGGTVARDLLQAAALAPVSLVPQGDGSYAHFPHLIERAKPGLIAVNAQGERFANEADSYHDFLQALIRTTAGSCVTTTSCAAMGWARSSPRPCHCARCWPTVTCNAVPPWRHWRRAAASCPPGSSARCSVTTAWRRSGLIWTSPKAKPPTTASRAMRRKRPAAGSPIRAWHRWRRARFMPSRWWRAAWARLPDCASTRPPRC